MHLGQLVSALIRKAKSTSHCPLKYRKRYRNVITKLIATYINIQIKAEFRLALFLKLGCEGDPEYTQWSEE